MAPLAETSVKSPRRSVNAESKCPIGVDRGVIPDCRVVCQHPLEWCKEIHHHSGCRVHIQCEESQFSPKDDPLLESQGSVREILSDFSDDFRMEELTTVVDSTLPILPRLMSSLTCSPQVSNPVVYQFAEPYLPSVPHCPE